MTTTITYSSLVQSVLDYTKRSDEAFQTQIPLFIMLAQQRLARDLKIVGVKQTVSDTLLVGNPLLQKPFNWLTTSSFFIKVGQNLNPDNFIMSAPLYQRSFEFCELYWPDSSILKEPKYFNDDVNVSNFLIYPTPDKSYPCMITLYVLPNMLDNSVQTNIFTQYAPTALLYRTLVEAYMFLKDHEQTSLWLQTYINDVGSLKLENKERMIDGFAKRGS
jgi:hypothetical protein